MEVLVVMEVVSVVVVPQQMWYILKTYLQYFSYYISFSIFKAGAGAGSFGLNHGGIGGFPQPGFGLFGFGHDGGIGHGGGGLGHSSGFSGASANAGASSQSLGGGHGGHGGLSGKTIDYNSPFYQILKSVK